MKPKGRRIAIGTAALAVGVLALAVWLSWPHLQFWYLFEPLGMNAQGYREYRHRQTGIGMVRLPGGTFWMGAQEDDPNGRNYDQDAEPCEKPVYMATQSEFFIGKYEVTQGQWNAVMGSNPSHFKGDDLRPVENVSWNDIQHFEAKTGLALPTEVQWEYACRVGRTTAYSGTEEIDGAWYRENSDSTTHAVGQKEPNHFGLYDVHGNVSEWCEDFWDPECIRNDNPVARYWRVTRSGGWDSPPSDLRTSLARGDDPSSRYDCLGFRVAFQRR